MPDASRWFVRFRLPWLMLLFLVGYYVLLVALSGLYLIPAFRALQDADPEQRAALVAWSRLLLAVVLAMLFIGLIVTFRVRRYFMAERARRGSTVYPDAWSESARRQK